MYAKILRFRARRVLRVVIQPFLLLSKGNVPARETLLINYVSRSNPRPFFLVTDCQCSLGIGERILIKLSGVPLMDL